MMSFTPTHPPTRREGLRVAIRVVGFLCLLLGLLATTLPHNASSSAQESGDDTVVVINIHGVIAPGLGHYLDRAIGEAGEMGATAIILDLNTPGGRLDTVLEMRDSIMDTDIHVIAYVNREAFSAGALITIASDEIWMAPGAVFGAATPVDGATGDTASEKTVSAVRSVFRATAEENGRDPAIAEAMVDPAVEIEGLDDSRQLLTLSTEQALEHGYADGIAPTGSALLQETGYGDATVVEIEMNLWERAVGWVTDPLVASLLVFIGLGLIVADGLVGGFGIVAIFGVASLALFFWGHLLAGLAGWEDVVLIALGLGLIALEIFVIPGFGIAGVVGIVSLIGGLLLAMTRREIGDEGFAQEAGDVLTTLVITLAATVFLLAAFAWILPRVAPQALRPARGLQHLSLGATVDEGGADPYAPGWLTKLFGGEETVGRDDEGHTAISLRQQRGEESRGKSPGGRTTGE